MSISGLGRRSLAYALWLIALALAGTLLLLGTGATPALAASQASGSASGGGTSGSGGQGRQQQQQQQIQQARGSLLDQQGVIVRQVMGPLDYETFKRSARSLGTTDIKKEKEFNLYQVLVPSGPRQGSYLVFQRKTIQTETQASPDQALNVLLEPGANLIGDHGTLTYIIPPQTIGFGPINIPGITLPIPHHPIPIGPIHIPHIQIPELILHPSVSVELLPLVEGWMRKLEKQISQAPEVKEWSIRIPGWLASRLPSKPLTPGATATHPPAPAPPAGQGRTPSVEVYFPLLSLFGNLNDWSSQIAYFALVVEWQLMPGKRTPPQLNLQIGISSIAYPQVPEGLSLPTDFLAPGLLYEPDVRTITIKLGDKLPEHIKKLLQKAGINTQALEEYIQKLRDHLQAPPTPAPPQSTSTTSTEPARTGEEQAAPKPPGPTQNAPHQATADQTTDTTEPAQTDKQAAPKPPGPTQNATHQGTTDQTTDTAEPGAQDEGQDNQEGQKGQEGQSDTQSESDRQAQSDPAGHDASLPVCQINQNKVVGALIKSEPEPWVPQVAGEQVDEGQGTCDTTGQQAPLARDPLSEPPVCNDVMPPDWKRGDLCTPLPDLITCQLDPKQQPACTPPPNDPPPPCNDVMPPDWKRGDPCTPLPDPITCQLDPKQQPACTPPPNDPPPPCNDVMPPDWKRGDPCVPGPDMGPCPDPSTILGTDSRHGCWLAMRPVNSLSSGRAGSMRQHGKGRKQTNLQVRAQPGSWLQTSRTGQPRVQPRLHVQGQLGVQVQSQGRRATTAKRTTITTVGSLQGQAGLQWQPRAKRQTQTRSQLRGRAQPNVLVQGQGRKQSQRRGQTKRQVRPVTQPLLRGQLQARRQHQPQVVARPQLQTRANGSGQGHAQTARQQTKRQQRPQAQAQRQVQNQVHVSSQPQVQQGQRTTATIVTAQPVKTPAGAPAYQPGAGGNGGSSGSRNAAIDTKAVVRSALASAGVAKLAQPVKMPPVEQIYAKQAQETAASSPDLGSVLNTSNVNPSSNKLVSTLGSNAGTSNNLTVDPSKLNGTTLNPANPAQASRSPAPMPVPVPGVGAITLHGLQ